MGNSAGWLTGLTLHSQRLFHGGDPLFDIPPRDQPAVAVDHVEGEISDRADTEHRPDDVSRAGANFLY